MKKRKNIPYAIGVDIGGTSIRCGLISSVGKLFKGSYKKIPADSKGSAKTILDTFTSALRNCLKKAKVAKLNLVGIGIGMCGPLDYDKGISLIKGVDKYESLYGINLKNAFRKRLKLCREQSRPFLTIVFEPDSWAFARGEAWLGAGKDYQRILAITLGTGFGSAFVVNEELLADGPGVPPPYGWIGSLPFRNGKLDDFISKRGILNLYQSLVRNGRDRSLPLPKGFDIKDIALKARTGDTISQKVFKEFGKLLGKALVPSLKQFRAECLILGGQISKSFDLFKEPLLEELARLRLLKKITVAHSLNFSALKGAARFVFIHTNRVL